MHPPVKTQTDIGADDPKIDAADGTEYVAYNGDILINRDTARQEFAQEADINYMLNRFGITPERNTPMFGEWDDSIDLQQALTSVAEARTAYRDLPDALKQKFSSMEELLTAYHKGALVIKDEAVPIPVKTETELLQDRVTELTNRINAAQPNP